MTKPSLTILPCTALCLSWLFFLSSCKSDFISPQKKVDDNKMQSFTDAAKAPESTKFGIFYNSLGKGNEGLLLNVGYQRIGVVLTQFTGTFQVMNWLEDSGFQLLVNVNYAPLQGKATPFVRDISLYKQKLNNFITSYKPEVAVIENEEDNKLYHSGPAIDYINELTAATALCHAQGVKVTNGGLTTRRLTYLVYEYYLQHNQPDSAASFAARAIPISEMRDLNNRNIVCPINTNIIFDSTLVAAYKTIPLDYVNIHFYEPVFYADDTKTSDTAAISAVHQATPGVLQEIVNYLERVTGKVVMSNETGQINNSPTLVTGMLQNSLNAKLPYALWYDATGGNNGAVGLTDSTGALQPNGVAFKKFVKSH